MADISFSDLTENVGVEAHGLDLREPLSDTALAALMGVMADRSVVLVRGQDITPEQHIAFSRHLGPLEDHVLRNFCLPDHPEIFVVSNIVENGKHVGAFGGVSRRPPLAQRLFATCERRLRGELNGPHR